MREEEEQETSEEGNPDGSDVTSMNQDDPRQTVELEREKGEQYFANWQRAEADMVNFKRRSEQQREEALRFGASPLAASILSIVDDLTRALDNVSPALAGFTWVEGIQIIHRKLQAMLQTHGVEEIKTEGQQFDPHVHEAVLQREGPEGDIVDEIQKGYLFHGRVLRPALVAVGNGNAALNYEETEESESVDDQE